MGTSNSDRKNYNTKQYPLPMVRSLQGKHPQYYEAILQLRNTQQDVMDFVEVEIARAGIPVTKVVELKQGLDYYLADNNFTKALGKKLQQQFGGELLSSASLHTRKNNKDLYRVTILFRSIPFRKGDVVEYQGEPYVITGMGKDILLKNTKTGIKAHLKYGDAKQVKIIE